MAGTASHGAVCESAWAALQQSVQILSSTGGGIRTSIPLLYLQQTLQTLQEHGNASEIAALLESGGVDGLVVARCLYDQLSAVSILLILAEESIAKDTPGEAASDHEWVQVALQCWEHKLQHSCILLRLLGGKGESSGESWTEALTHWSPEDFFTSGGLRAFWRKHFPSRFVVSSAEFMAALAVGRHMAPSAIEELRPWLRPGNSNGDDCIDLADTGLLLESLGISRGICFGTTWEVLCGHSYLTVVNSEQEWGRRVGASAADLVVARREKQSGFLINGWSRELLSRHRSLLRALLALGISVACDTVDGASLILQFDCPDVAACVAPPLAVEGAPAPAGAQGRSFVSGSGGKRTRLGEALATAAQQGGEGFPEVAFEPVGKQTASSSMSALVVRTHCLGKAEVRHKLLTESKAHRLSMLNDLLTTFDVLAARRRATEIRRVSSCDPTSKSEASSKLFLALQEQRIMEEQAASRKQQLIAMEKASANPDQIAHIRVLLQEVAEAEDEKDRHQAWVTEQRPKWIGEEEDFQQTRQKQDLACRQRLAAMFLELRQRQRQEGEFRAMLSRTESMLMDLEDVTSSNRQRLHDYDEELTSMIHDKENLLVNLMEVMEGVKEQVLAADEATAARKKELEGLARILELRANRAQQLDEIDQLERRLEALKAKSNMIAAGPA
mmetsp:Transcript_28418/g.61896  ORF Transcript_28418/g.61896 Transcript_28418/m.61896 type:complete len:673 (-) Transcript_28418:63-2081(-)